MRARTGRIALSGAMACAAALLMAAADAAPTDRLGNADARHLLARTGFGPTGDEVGAYAPLTRAEAVDRILRETRTTPVTPPPTWALEHGPLRPPGPDADVAMRQVFRQKTTRDGLELRAWWIGEMLATPSPLTERMTLFWHNHFVSSQQKVRFAELMYRQNATFRAHALGDFATLLDAALKEPAMLVYLDAVQNRRGQPNENLAREMMELFTLGEGRYGEQDVREAARALTGWSLDRDSGRFVFRRGLHDAGLKTVLGVTAAHDGDSIIALLLARAETAEWIVAKLWREFVAPDVDAAEVRRIAAAFRGSNFAIKVALREILLSEPFYASAHRGVLVKSPIEVVVGTLRQLDLRPQDGLPFAVTAAGMGQNLFSPPNVKGWPGGEHWINANTLLARKQFLERLTRLDAPDAIAMRPRAAMEERTTADGLATADERERGQRFGRAVERGMRDLSFDNQAWVAALPGETAGQKREAAVRLLLPLSPRADVIADASGTGAMRALLLDPAFQLK